MIYKVQIENKLDPAMTLTHVFEAIVETEEQAQEFGKEASQIALAFNAGFGGTEVDD